jgi:cytochrome c553
MRLRRRHILVTAVAAPAIAVLVAWIGFFNIGASSGHWRITEWFLELAMRSAIRTYALAVDAPDALPKDALIPAAGHYAEGCAFCHGAGGVPRNPAVRAMLPVPPDLSATVDEWTDAQLFRIIKHGIRFTGMPAWPTQTHDDEVWMMVAFLRALPEFDSNDHRRPAIADAAMTEPLARCTACHGIDGRGGGAHVPILAGQSETYLRESLIAYAVGDRGSGIMQLAVSGLHSGELAALAKHYAALPRTESPARPSDIIRAVELATRGRAADGIPPCLDCHTGDRDPHFPTLAGQRAEYIAAQLELFRARVRGGTAYRQVMTQVAQGLDDADIDALARYFAQTADVGAAGLGRP